MTVRCSEVFINDFLPEVRAVNPEAIQAIQDQINSGLEQIEAERGLNDLGLLEYCKSGNVANSGRQRKPCAALAQMMDALRKGIPSLAANAENPQSPKTVEGATKAITPGSAPVNGTQ